MSTTFGFSGVTTLHAASSLASDGSHRPVEVPYTQFFLIRESTIVTVNQPLILIHPLLALKHISIAGPNASAKPTEQPT
ncbi:hypothetical protein PTI98_013105 [Pleurotus ostreatus]|nr:hypothetical protein PTI98_013105 [Pleurotus ostreatus]